MGQMRRLANFGQRKIVGAATMSAPLRSASPGKVRNESDGTTHVNISRHVACEAKNSSEAFAARCDHCGSERIVAAGITLRKPFWFLI